MTLLWQPSMLVVASVEPAHAAVLLKSRTLSVSRTVARAGWCVCVCVQCGAMSARDVSLSPWLSSCSWLSSALARRGGRGGAGGRDA